MGHFYKKNHIINNPGTISVVWWNSCWWVQCDFSDLLKHYLGWRDVGICFFITEQIRNTIWKTSQWQLSAWGIGDGLRAACSSLSEILIVLNSVFWKTFRHPSVCVKSLVTELWLPWSAALLWFPEIALGLCQLPADAIPTQSSLR